MNSENLEDLDYEELLDLYIETDDEKYMDAMISKEHEDSPWTMYPFI